jgi:hypothetical protein
LRLLDDDNVVARLKADALRRSPAAGEQVLATIAQSPFPMVT